jgi:hypothetical protein
MVSEQRVPTFSIGHGTFSLVPAFPFPVRMGFGATGLECQFTGVLGQTCDASVSIAASERLLGH